MTIASLRIGVSPGAAPGWWAASRDKQGLFLILPGTSVIFVAINVLNGVGAGEVEWDPIHTWM
jgi:hypothetical protein